MNSESTYRILLNIFKNATPYLDTEDERSMINEAFHKCRSISIDYGILEKSDNVHVLKGNFVWSDLGTWESISQFSKKDAKNNCIAGKVTLFNTERCIVKSNSKNLIIEGLKDYIVIDANNSIIICRRSKEQEIKNYVTIAKKQ